MAPTEPPVVTKCPVNAYGNIRKGYRGSIAATRDGKKCQRWVDQEPHKHNRTAQNFPNSGLGKHNFCRNPDDDDEGAWCYTTDENERWDYCSCGMLLNKHLNTHCR